MEYFVVVVLFAILFFQMAYSFEFGAALVGAVSQKLLAFQSERIYFPLLSGRRRRRFSQRGIRWGFGADMQKPARDHRFSSESAGVRRRRLVLYVLNSLRFRAKLGLLGEPTYSSKPIRPKLPFSWLQFEKLLIAQTGGFKPRSVASNLSAASETRNRRLATLKDYHEELLRRYGE